MRAGKVAQWRPMLVRWGADSARPFKTDRAALYLAQILRHHGEEPTALLKLWPSFAIYLVSFFLTTIYWINHHGLMTQARHITARLLWANSGVLFSASLIPFATAYVAETGLAPFPTAIYGALQCIWGLALGVMFRTIVQQRDDEAFRRRARIRRRQNLVAVGVYAVSAGTAFVSPTLAISLLTAVSLAYVAPTLAARRIRSGARASRFGAGISPRGPQRSGTGLRFATEA
jgi:uncharacterized membrane protein